MSDVLILEFDGVTEEHYKAVNKLLDVDAGEQWPAPLLIHVAGVSDTGLVVVEVWESQAAQGEFMKQLAPALEASGVPAPRRMEWLAFAGQHTT